MVDPKSITTELVQERFSDALAARCGPGKAVSVSALAEQTGIDERTINAWRRREATACLSKMLKVAAALGPGVVNDVFVLAGLGGMERLEAPDAPDSYGINADLSAALAMFGRHLADGRIDHRELAEQRPELGALYEAIGRWIAAYDQGQGDAVTPLRATGRRT
ncbi:hypothetical protein [Roseospira goensis]|uniref:Transcriptional regulator with XRE-family HTH domain n=1 Tax=Roseospira goensis TaxID=391922 RepID=A0A7W6S4A8_9PROT|nr:hypothetical protein [Roseospira goensis]MBB4287922.1 transcriptional regulator with XRE-family HTH domain [Roseospira goensis]